MRDHYYYHETASVAQWSEFLATDPEVWVRFPAIFGVVVHQPRE
jgi:hypothetical protein